MVYSSLITGVIFIENPSITRHFDTNEVCNGLTNREQKSEREEQSLHFRDIYWQFQWSNPAICYPAYGKLILHPSGE